MDTQFVFFQFFSDIFPRLWRRNSRFSPNFDHSVAAWNRKICTDPMTSSLHEVAGLMESLHGHINDIQQQHSPELRSFAVNEVNLTGYTDEHNMLQAMITL